MYSTQAILESMIAVCATFPSLPMAETAYNRPRSRGPKVGINTRLSALFAKTKQNEVEVRVLEVF
jgi:hypothetical protein